MSDQTESRKADDHLGMITENGAIKPRISLPEFGMVVGVFLLCGVSLYLLEVWPRDWKADDARNKERTLALMSELYSALQQYTSDYGVENFPPEIDNFLHNAPLEWRRLGVCPASHRRFSIQLIPGWKVSDIKDHPTELLAYDYNEDELRYKDMNWKNVSVSVTDSEGNVSKQDRPLDRTERIAILTGDYSTVVDEFDDGIVQQLRVLRDRFLSEATMGRNFSDGHAILLLDGSTKFVTDREFAAYRLRIFHRELMKQARRNNGLLPMTAAEAVAQLHEDEGSWWLKNSLGINPGSDEFVGWRMPDVRVSLEDGPDTVLMFDKSPYTHSGRNVLFLSGEVKFMSEAVFRRLMDEGPDALR